MNSQHSLANQHNPPDRDGKQWSVANETDSGLTHELAVCRYLLQHAIDTGNINLVHNLLSTIGTLCEEQNELKRQGIFSPDEDDLNAFADLIVSAIARSFSGQNASVS